MNSIMLPAGRRMSVQLELQMRWRRVGFDEPVDNGVGSLGGFSDGDGVEEMVFDVDLSW